MRAVEDSDFFAITRSGVQIPVSAFVFHSASSNCEINVKRRTPLKVEPAAERKPRYRSDAENAAAGCVTS